MRQIHIPLSKLIKYIPSEADGGVIPGKVLFCDYPNIVRPNSYEVQLHYRANSALNSKSAFCKLDEEVEMVPGSNQLDKLPSSIGQYPHQPILFEDGVVFEFNKIAAPPYWDTARTWCVVPSPFGFNPLSPFTRHGLVQIACCYMGHGIHIAVIGKDFHKVTEKPIVFSRLDADTFEPMTFGAPCQHNVGWLIPWQSESKGINIAWLEDKEMDEFVLGAIPLPKA